MSDRAAGGTAISSNIPVVRVVGPAGSGKSLLITSLIEAFRARGRLVASSAPRVGIARTGPNRPVTAPHNEPVTSSGQTAAKGRSIPEPVATVITLSNGGRVTIERALDLAALRSLVPSLDPRADLLLAEALEELGAPAVELLPPGTSPTTPAAILLAAVATSRVQGDFATFGPGETHGLAELIESRVLRAKDADPPKRRRSLFARLRGH